MTFKKGNELAIDLESVVEEKNQEWIGKRCFKVLDYNGGVAEMQYLSVEPIKTERTHIRYLQMVSQILAYGKGWNERVTRKAGSIFTVN